MKSVLIVAALCAALGASTPAVQAKGMSDMDLFCKFFPLTSKCAPAKTTAAPAKAAPVVVAMAKAAVAPMSKMTIKMYHCVPAKAGSGHLYDCTWK